MGEWVIGDMLSNITAHECLSYLFVSNLHNAYLSETQVLRPYLTLF